MNIAFGEDSYLPGENGRDMIWNPTPNIYNDNGNYPVIGGKHFLYIFGTGNHGIGRNVPGDRYYTDADVNEGRFDRFKLGLQSTTAGGNPATLQKRIILSQVNWVIPTYLAAGYDMTNGIPPTEVRIKVRVAKSYTSFSTGDDRNSPDWNGDGLPDGDYALPMYEFDGSEIAPKIGDLVCYSRQSGVDYDTKGSYKSHCDLVVKKSKNQLELIGGNVSQAVTKRIVSVDSKGMITDKNKDWFAVIKTNI